MRVGVLGCGGRMGRAVLREAIRAKGCTLGGEAKLRALGEQLKALRERRPGDKVTPPTVLTRAL